MPTSTIEWRHERHEKLLDARRILDKADEESRALTTEERSKHGALLEEADALSKRINDTEIENGKERQELAEQFGHNTPGAGRESRRSIKREDTDHRFTFIDEGGEEVRSIRHDESYRAACGYRPEAFSVGKLIRGLACGIWDGAETEKRAAYSEGTSATGGYLLSPAQSAKVIDLARAKSVVSAAGAVTVPMTTETLKLAVVESDPTAYWTAENASITESEGTFAAVQLRARALAVYCEASLELMRDSANAGQIIEATITAALAQKLDATFLNGSGADPVPTGLLNATGVATYDVGGAISHDHLLNGCRALWRENVEPAAMIYDPNVRAAIAKLKDGDGEYQPVPPEVAGLTRHMASTVSSTDSNAAMYIGDFSNCLIGLRSDIEIEMSGTAGTAFQTKKIAIRGLLRADFAVARANDVVRMGGITGTT